MRSFLIKVGWFLAVVTVAAFFLPWVKLETAAFNRVAERQRIANQLEAEADQPWYQRYFSLRPQDTRVALHDPLSGVSGLTLVEWARGTASVQDREKVRNVAEAFGLTGPTALLIGAVSVYAVPALALLGMILFTIGMGARLPLFLCAAACFGLYFLFRYRLDEAFLDRTVLGVAPGAGLWIALYGLALVGLVLLVDAILPDGKR
jgi:hypothetical protein